MEYEKKRDRAIYEQRIRTEKSIKSPRIKKNRQGDMETGLSMSKAVIENPKNYKEDLQRVKEKLKI